MDRKIILIIVSVTAVAALAWYLFDKPNSRHERVEEATATSTSTLPAEESEPQTMKEETENYSVAYTLPPSGTVGADDVRVFITNHAADFKANADQFAPESLSDGSAASKYVLDVGVEQYVTDTHHSYVIMMGEYTGGASANQSVRTFVYERVTGKLLGLDDIISPDAEDKVIAEIRAQLYEINGGSPEDEAGFGAVVKDLSLNDVHNFYLTDSSLVILFSKYEVAPGALGTVSVELPLVSFKESI